MGPFTYGAFTWAQGMAGPGRGRECQIREAPRDFTEQACVNPEIHLALTRVLLVCHDQRKVQEGGRQFSQGKTGVGMGGNGLERLD